MSDGALKLLRKKHPKVKIDNKKALLQGPKQPIHSVVIDDIDEEFTLNATVETKDACGPSGLDAENWHRIFNSLSLGSSSVSSGKWGYLGQLRKKLKNLLGCNKEQRIIFAIPKINLIVPGSLKNLRSNSKVTSYVLNNNFSYTQLSFLFLI